MTADIDSRVVVLEVGKSIANGQVNALVVDVMLQSNHPGRKVGTSIQNLLECLLIGFSLDCSGMDPPI